MKITSIVAHPYSIPFKGSFKTAHGPIYARDGAIIELHTDTDITGLGEIAPMPDFAGDTLTTTLAPLPSVAAQLHSSDLSDALTLIQHSQLPSATICGLEIALLDALAQAQHCPLSRLLYATPQSHVAINAVVGAPNIIEAVQQARSAVSAGFTCIKLKLSAHTEETIERITAVRTAIGPTIHLRLDANEAWELAQARTILSACAHLAIQYIEQPLKASDLTGMHALRNSVTIPIAVDEALIDLASARRILTAQAADIFIIKPQLAGGISMAQQIIQQAAAQGIQSVITSTFETGIGLAALLHLVAASPAITLESGLGTLNLLANDLLSTTLPIQQGTLTVPTTPGLGVQLDRQALTDYARGRGTQ